MPHVVAYAAAWVGSAVLAAGASTAVATFAYYAAYVLTTVALSMAVSYATSRILAPKSSIGSLRQQAMQVNTRDPAAPRQIIYGQRKVSGVLYPVGVSGANNEYLHALLLIAGHECEELGDVYFNTDVVPLDGSGNATGTYAGYARIKKHLGAHDQTVDTDLQSDLGSGTWTNNHRLRGIAHLYLRLKVGEVFNGGLPEIWCMVKGRKVWDPADVAQSATDASTWEWSANAALCQLDWLRGVPTRNSAGTIIRNYGLGAPDAEIDLPAAIEAAGICDEDIVLDDASTEKRYTANGLIMCSTLAGDGIDLFRTAMAGDCLYIGGKWVIRAGAYRTPTVTLTESDFRAPLTDVVIKPSRRELINGVKGVYLAPENNWQPSDFPPVTNSTYTTEDGSERLWRDIELPLTTSPATAQRLAKIILEESRQPIQFVAKLKLTALQVQATDVVLYTDPFFGWTAKPFRVVGFAFAVENDANGNPYLGIDLTLRETAAGIYDWADGEETVVDLAPNTDLPNPFTVAAASGLSLTNVGLLEQDGTVVPKLLVTWSAPADEYAILGKTHIEYKKHSLSTWFEWSSPPGNLTSDVITDVEANVYYDVRIWHENNLGVRGNADTESNFLVTKDTTGPAAPTGFTVIPGDESSSERPPTVLRAGIELYACRVLFSESTSKDIAFYEVGTTTSSSPDPSSTVDIYGSEFPCLKGSGRFDVYKVATSACYVWIRGVDNTGNRGTFALVGNVAADLKRPLTDAELDGMQSLTAVDIIATSSRRYKRNIRTIKRPLRKAAKLRGVTYTEKKGGRRGNVGLIAEEVHKVIPSVVKLDAAGRPEGIDYGHLVGLLVECVKELDQRTRPKARRRRTRRRT